MTRQPEQIESPKIDPCKYTQLIMSKRQSQFHRARKVGSTNCYRIIIGKISCMKTIQKK